MLWSEFKIMDDTFSIVKNQTIQNESQWPQLFKEGYFKDHSYYRPLTNLSYAIEYKFFGLNPFNYNLDNVLLHITNALLVWALVALLINIEVGFWVALIFAIHPIQWESVSNISGRAILLGSFFSLLTFIFFIKKRLIFALMAFGLGLLCKESTAIMPAIMFVYALGYRRSFLPLFLFAPILGAYMFARHYFGITEFFAWRNMHEAVTGFVTFLSSVIMYLRLLILPTDLHFDRSLRLFSSIFEIGAILSVMFWGVMIGMLAAWYKKLLPIHWIALVWFGVTLLPVSQIVTTIGVQPGFISCAEHFLYFTCIPVFIVAVYHLHKVKSNAIRLVFLGMFVFFGITTIEQNIYARSDLAMMDRSLRMQPDNARLNSSVGLIHALNGRYKEAEGYFKQAVDADPLNPRFLISWGKSICDQGRYAECLKIYDSIQNPAGYDKLLAENKSAALRLMKDNP